MPLTKMEEKGRGERGFFFGGGEVAREIEGYV